MLKKLFVFIVLMIHALPSLGAENDFAPAQNAVVTSVQKCLEQLDPADAADIRARFVQPYQECQKRLSAKLEQKKQADSKAAAETPVPVTPRNFVRVKEDNKKTIPPKTEDKKEDKK